MDYGLYIFIAVVLAAVIYLVIQKFKKDTKKDVPPVQGPPTLTPQELLKLWHQFGRTDLTIEDAYKWFDDAGLPYTKE